MYRQNNELLQLLAPVIEAMGYQLLGIEQHARGAGTLLCLYIDHADGISLEDCERVSQQVTGVLDVHDPIKSTYVLEVSSPGLDRPLFTLEQILRYTGHRVKLQLRQKIDGRRRLTGEIRSVADDQVVVVVDDIEFTVLAANIDKARLVPDYVN